MENRSLHIAESFIEASNTLINGAVLKAGFDKTIKANIKQLLDKPTGKYKVKYQDSQFQAFATSADIHYEEGQEVSVLIPGNDWDRDKTIVGSRPGSAMTYKQMPITDQQYNAVGPNGISIRVGEDSTAQQTELYRTGVIGIRSGLNESFSIKDFINISNIKSYIIKGNCIALNMIVRTDFGASQVGGNYGLRFALKFKDPIATTDPDNPVYTIKSFTVSDADLFGNPYQVNVPTSVSTLITNVDTENFESIQDIYAYTEGFPQFQGEEFQSCPVDIFISGIGINGGISLTEEELEGYIVHINDPDGGVLKPEEEENPAINVIKLIGELKVHGQLITQNVDYYWFIQNGTVFQGMDQYSGHAGEGWQCLNPKVGTTFSPFKVPYFYFAASEDVIEQDLKENKNYFIEDLCKKVKVCCVAFYQGKNIKGEYIVTNENISTDIVIDSSQKKEGQNKTQYYLGNGHPTLHCIFDQQGEHEYVWTIKPANDSLINQTENSQIPKFTPFLKEEGVYYTYIGAKDRYEEYLKELSESDGSKGAAEAITAPFDWESEKDKEYIDGQYYINFPINSIINSTKITCAVYSVNQNKEKTYRGSASITLYNKMQLQGMYTLVINNGTQIFQYDEKGNSPFVEQADRKPMEQPKPLTFTLLDNTGTQIAYNQIIDPNYGSVRWLFPKNQTLLTTTQKDFINNNADIVMNSTDSALAADFYILKNKPSFTYSIEDRYSLSKTNNNIGLLINYKENSLQAWTDFTFPKNGDPGTNGTQLIAKIVPKYNDIEYSSDRIYAKYPSENNHQFFTDSGDLINKLDFNIFNNNIKLQNIDSHKILWSCPPKNKYNEGDLSSSGHTFLKYSSTEGLRLQNLEKDLKSFAPIDIIRGQYGFGSDKNQTKYYAEIPICYEHITGRINKNKGSAEDYRIKLKPKTGFKYVTYASDGTRPDYDNSKPFEIIVERLDSSNTEYSFYTKSDISDIACKWEFIGNYLEMDTQKNNQESIGDGTNKCYVKPAVQFDGLALYSAIVVTVKAKDGQDDQIENGEHIQKQIGFIHIPIYMNLNRYGNNAINGWDGNSIELKEGSGTILAPQVGAGKKDDNNTFTGVLMGVQRPAGAEDETQDQVGLFGYHHGDRSIFLDAQTGNATFGKQGAAQIKINAQSGQGTIASGDYSPRTYRRTTDTEINTTKTYYILNENNKYIKVENPRKADLNKYYEFVGYGMKIKFSSTGQGSEQGPYIKYGSGNFSVNSEGHIHAAGGGDIAGWNIDDNRIYKGNTGMSSQVTTVKDIDPSQNRPQQNDTVAFYAGQTQETGETKNSPNFYVTHKGYLFSKSGKIGGWNISDYDLTNGTVGMNSEPDRDAHNGKHKINDKLLAKAFFAGNNNQFYVTHDGFLRSTSGKIATWEISPDYLQDTDGKVGMGERGVDNNTLNKIFKSNLTKNKKTTLKFWAGDKKASDDNLKFAVDSDGKLYSNDGFIAGWRIGQTSLTSDGYTKEKEEITKGITINKDGSLYGPGWYIESNGDASFNHLQGIIAPVSSKGPAVSLKAGEGFFVDSTGYFQAGNGDQALTYTPAVKGSSSSLQMGNWRIQGDQIYYGEKSNGTRIDSDEIFVFAAPGSTDHTAAMKAGYFQISGKSGRSGTIKFSDGAVLTVSGGIIVGCEPGSSDGDVIPDLRDPSRG